MRTYKWPPQPPYELEVVGVTSIISNGIPKPFLEGWAAKMTAECAVDKYALLGQMIEGDSERAAIDWLKNARYRDRDTKANRGTIVHAAIESYLNGKPMSKADLEERLAEDRIPRPRWKGAAGMVAAAMEFLFEMEPEVLHSEATVYSRHYGYAGTTDLFARMRIGRSKRPVVIDFKTSKKIYDETSLQLCAYSRADFIGLNDGTEVPMPKGDIRDGIAVRLMPSGKFEPVAFSLTDELFDVFIAARDVAHGKAVIEGARRPKF